jgi:hypothetical protein
MTVRIVLDSARPPETSWCWREDWYTGMCSAFGLILKFGLLNAVSGKEIAKAFISKKCGIKSETCASPNVDLRDARLFDIEIMAEAFRITPKEIRASFLFELLPKSGAKSSEHLRWCEQCLARGFHTPVFQMVLVSACPIHQKPLRSLCRWCGQSIAYRLRQDLLEAPFCCPHCKEDMAPGLRDTRANVLLPRPDDRKVLAETMAFLQLEEESVCAKMEMERRVQQYGQGELIFSKPSADGRMSRYIGFVSQVIDHLRFAKSEAQAALSMESLELAERGMPAAVHPDDEDPALRHPSWANQTDRAGNIDPVGEPLGDAEIRSVTTVYQSVRRHLWKHVIRRHRRCVVAAARHLWWRMDEETTASFCPIAEAYIRWRMAWEGCGTPRYLFGAPRRQLYGLVGWVSSRPPPCPNHWPRPTQLWVVDHIFANASLESFRERLSDAMDNHAKGTIHWKRSLVPVRYDTYWAVTGSDAKGQPAVVYLRCPMAPPAAADGLPRGRQHQASHRARLASIVR